MDISSRLPKQKEIAAVYSVIVIMIYGWTILKFNYNLPGWLYFLDVGQIASFFAYSMVTNLLESLLVLSVVIIAAVIMPGKWFSEAFIPRGAAFSILALGLMMFVASQFKSRDDYPIEIIRWSPALLVLIALTAYFLSQQNFARKALEFIADRAIIFLYVTIPLSLISLLVVLFRLIL